ncbi:hypothetical protein A2531_06680 [Candidatus Falkowbacteria bacterium RIFOXYD2_FULL_34_120]|uniref:DUF8173 domain-containing protein n=1 Tax=Candidatus Falkowbacteria bacterium RIFOXYD2_FULL_34_120 TaxID=1798007 RepID=A0A1F5TPS0_9BACT|nr:MAG: hypothetical protein A2500_02845 [Candidatus Falkowbacteria bacterium RIFOXYC12_FULL_34_55]OGF40837.1 MAG: hypothetical protein A2531_06680 [Candidatus Falkowbacteria bacterium RIFOXYD2_FULL_34_120]
MPVSVIAFEVQNKDTVFIDKEETIKGNLYAFGTSVIINGKVDGDVICLAGESLKINGTVTGDVIAGASLVDINGEIGGSVRVVGEMININGDVIRGVQALASSVSFGESSNVGMDVLLVSASSNIDGDIAGSVHGYSAKVNIFGDVGGDIKLRMDARVKNSKDTGFTPLIIQDSANIGGNVYYISSIKGFISEKASIGGEVGHTFYNKKRNDVFSFGNIVSLFAWMIIGLIIISLVKKDIKKLTKNNKTAWWKLVGIGILVMFITPVVCVLVLFTVIGIPAALISFILWIIVIYLAKILTGIMIGEKIINKFLPKKKDSLMWMMIFGILSIWVLCSLPVVGWMFCLAATWYGIGSVWYYLKYSNT